MYIESGDLIDFHTVNASMIIAGFCRDDKLMHSSLV